MDDDPPLDGDDMPVVERVAQDLIRQFGAAALGYVRDQADVAAGQGAAMCTETWRDIADAIERHLSDPTLS